MNQPNDPSDVRPVDPAREARYAEALRRADDEVIEQTNFGRLTATYDESTHAVMAVADEERAGDAATIAELRAEVERLTAERDRVEALADEWMRLSLPGMTDWDYGADVLAALAPSTSPAEQEGDRG